MRRLLLPDMDEAARVLRASYDDRLPWLAGRQTPAEDAWFFRERLFRDCEIWGADRDGRLAGIMALKPGWIEQLYVAPARQRTGIGTAFLAHAKQAHTRLELWTFQRNDQARRFYERQGFREAERTDGARNQEHEPDIRYEWLVGGDGFEPPTLSV